MDNKYIYCPEHKNWLLKGRRHNVYDNKYTYMYYCPFCKKAYKVGKTGVAIATKDFSVIGVKGPSLSGTDYDSVFHKQQRKVTDGIIEACEKIKNGEYTKAVSLFKKYNLLFYLKGVKELIQARKYSKIGMLEKAVSVYSKSIALFRKEDLFGSFGIRIKEEMVFPDIIDHAKSELDAVAAQLETQREAKRIEKEKKEAREAELLRQKLLEEEKEKRLAEEKQKENEINCIDDLISKFSFWKAKEICDRYGIDFFKRLKAPLYQEDWFFYICNYYPSRIKNVPRAESYFREKIWRLKDGNSTAILDITLALVPAIISICEIKKFECAILTSVPSSKVFRTNQINKCISKMVNLFSIHGLQLIDCSTAFIRTEDIRSAKYSYERPTYQEQYDTIEMQDRYLNKNGYRLSKNTGIFILDDVLTVGTQMSVCRDKMRECGINDSQIISLAVGRTVSTYY